MRAAIDRISAQTLGRIPDLSQVPLSRQIVLGAIIALLFHLIALPLIALLLMIGDTFAHLVFPRHEEPPPPAKQSLDVVVYQPAPEKTVVPAFEEHRQIFDPRGLEASQDKPKDPRFESDRDMVAGSQLPASGVLPLPSQEGRTDRPSADFADQDVRLQLSKEETAKSDSTSTNAEASSPNTAAQPAAAQAPAAPTPLYSPQPVSKEALAAAQKAPAEQKLPEPAKMTHATPPPLPKVVKPAADQIAVTRPTEVTQPGPITRPEAPPTPAPAQNATAARKDLAMLSTPNPLPLKRASDRYQESLQKTKIEGTISNRGQPGVDAIATPAGRWWMRTKNAIGQNWYLFLDQRRDVVATGSVRVAFAIDAEGKIHDVRIEQSSGNSSLEAVCLRALKDTPIPPPPSEVLEPFPNHRMDNSITFNYF